MPELNILTAIPAGAFAALVWGIILMRRVLRAPRFEGLTSKQVFAVYLAATIAFLPSLLLGFVLSFPLSHVTVSPGMWVHLAMALTLVVSLASAGTAVPVTVGWMIARFFSRRITLN